MTITISTNARLSDLRPKIMRQLYGNQKVYLFGTQNYGQPGDVYHLLHGVKDWTAIPDSYGHEVAYFQPHEMRPGWFVSRMIGADERISVAHLVNLINKGTVCALGKECPKHK
jgi:hypothetical protein